MSALSSLALIALLGAAPNDRAVVQFTSQRCTHCQAMQPIVAQLVQTGCPVQVIDIDQQPDVAKQFRIVGVPTFVALQAGRETGRLEGAASYEKLLGLWQQPGVGSQEPGNRSQESGVRSQEPAAARLNETLHAGANPELAARAATVRLKVEDAGGFGFGTGTIIDTHETEALVVTCGHLFRESQGKGKVTADIFVGGTSQTVEGQTISYDLDRDIALVSLRVPQGLRPVTVAPPGHLVRPGDRAFSIGCDKGADPSLRPTQITAVNKYKGKPNFTAAGQPVDGRSGGGLFTADGLLIGICNAADPADDEGLYAGLASIHWQLDQIGQAEVYQRAAKVAAAPSAPPDANVSLAAATAPLSPSAPPQMPTGSATAAVMPTAEPTPIAVAGDDAEIVFIVRSKTNPAQRSEVFVVDQAPPDLVARITHAARATGQQRAALGRANSAVAQTPATAQPPTAPPIVRGQSGAW